MRKTARFFLNDWKTPQRRTKVFILLLCALTLAATGLISRSMIFTSETAVLSAAWLFGFGFLFFNVVYLFLLSLAHLFLKKPALKERNNIGTFPKTAVLYPVRNESHGLIERIRFSFSGNDLPGTDLWILSDSSEEFIPYEKDLTEELGRVFPGRAFYRRRPEPRERKQGNIAEFLHAHPEYKYVYICDADGMIPEGTLLKLLRKAEHPENQGIGIFQCTVRIAHAATWYARFERIGARLSQRFSFEALQALLGESISFGHHHLARADVLRRIRLPKGLLSHDNWDTVLLSEIGYRVVFCQDVFAFDEAPSNYLEARARTKRWAKGTLQGWPLVFKAKASLAARFQAFYGIYLYLADIVFFLWAILGVLAHSEPTGQLIHFKIDELWFGLCTNTVLKWTLLFSLGVIFFHKVTILKNRQDVREYLYELGVSTFITLNNFLYVPLDMLAIPFQKLNWRPMAKNPFAKLDLRKTTEALWLGTIFGIYGLYFCTQLTPYFVWQAVPVLSSLILSIPLVYLTSTPMPQGCRRWI